MARAATVAAECSTRLRPACTYPSARLSNTILYTLLVACLLYAARTAILKPRMGSTFHEAIDAHVAIPAPHCGPGGTMYFNFGGSSLTDGTLGPTPHLRTANRI